MENGARWLLNNRIDHVLWLKTEGKMAAGTWDTIESQIRHAYFWRELYRADEFRVGIWSRALPIVPEHEVDRLFDQARRRRYSVRIYEVSASAAGKAAEPATTKLETAAINGNATRFQREPNRTSWSSWQRFRID